MRVNEEIAISTSKALLVPYEASHVLKYHGWMLDPAIQEATASEPLSLEEEYDNQVSWRVAHDKLTFIVCEPLNASTTHEQTCVQARKADSDERMRGDINFFLYADEDAPEDQVGRWLVGEVDVMIADKQHRGRGLGIAAVKALLEYIHTNQKRILDEYAGGGNGGGDGVTLKGLMAKIKESNAGSRALFGKLGFRQRGEVNYFGEVTMVMDWEEVQMLVESCVREDGYREMSYGGEPCKE